MATPPLFVMLTTFSLAVSAQPLPGSHNVIDPSTILRHLKARPVKALPWRTARLNFLPAPVCSVPLREAVPPDPGATMPAAPLKRHLEPMPHASLPAPSCADRNR